MERMDEKWQVIYSDKLWRTDETDAASPHGTLDHSSCSKIKDVFFVYLYISLMRYATATWMEWDQFMSSVWRVVSIDFFPLIYVPLQKTFYRFRKSNRSSKPLYPDKCFTSFAAGVSKWNCNKMTNMFSNRFLEYSLLPLDKQIALP